ncbi:DsrE family protein [Massilia jejuensis]|uniref:DsrE family protein n=1 Tax=Massilia jejuensis TaxID=648894 RepID=A0ABW0PIR6_9BURK
MLDCCNLEFLCVPLAAHTFSLCLILWLRSVYNSRGDSVRYFCGAGFMLFRLPDLRVLSWPSLIYATKLHGPGIDFLIEDAKDKNGTPYDSVVQELANRNVKFRVCNNTLEARKIDRKRILPEATVVPSGVAEVARLQFQEGYGYLKP